MFFIADQARVRKDCLAWAQARSRKRRLSEMYDEEEVEAEDPANIMRHGFSACQQTRLQLYERAYLEHYLGPDIAREVASRGVEAARKFIQKMASGPCAGLICDVEQNTNVGSILFDGTLPCSGLSSSMRHVRSALSDRSVIDRRCCVAPGWPAGRLASLLIEVSSATGPWCPSATSAHSRRRRLSWRRAGRCPRCAPWASTTSST